MTDWGVVLVVSALILVVMIEGFAITWLVDRLREVSDQVGVIDARLRLALRLDAVQQMRARDHATMCGTLSFPAGDCDES